MSRTFTEPEVQAANDSGCIFYSDPATLTDEMVDPRLRDAVRRINNSGWVWTAESCQGHPDADEAWAGNTRPMLRLVCRRERAGEMLAALCRAAAIRETADEQDGHFPLAYGFELWPNERANGWFEVLAYIPATVKGARDAGCRVFDQFSWLVT